MALVVEDGTGKSNANSYVSIAEADAFFVDLNYTDWAALTTAQKTGHLIAGTAYIDGRYRNGFAGYLLVASQALAWPRKYGWYTDTYPFTPIAALPTEVKKATYFAAYHSLNKELDEHIQSGIKSQSQGNMSVTYAGGSEGSKKLFLDIEQSLERVRETLKGHAKIVREEYFFGHDDFICD